jgi:uncharacterized protein
MLFADTSYWIALLKFHDQFHELAVELQVERSEAICTTDWVLVELANYFSAKQSRSDCSALVQDILRDETTAVVGCGELLTDAIDLYQARPDKQWSLTDCASFLLMDSMGIKRVLSTDHHFEQAGFEIVLK